MSRPASERRLRVTDPQRRLTISAGKVVDLEGFRTNAQARIEAALGALQVAIGEAELDNGDPIAPIRRASARLRRAAVSLECLRHELVEVLDPEQPADAGASHAKVQ